MAGQEDVWTTIESDPGVFTELIRLMGVRGVQVEELWSLEEELLKALWPVFGVIFLFKYQQEGDNRASVPETDHIGKIFFAKQVIPNACATQAILSVLLNRPEIELGIELTNLKKFTSSFSPELKGLTINNSDEIRRAHNSFAPPQPIVPEERMASKDDEAFHFIAYVPVDGVLYELDGLKPGPIRLCEATEEDWLGKVCPIIQSRIERYAQSEIRFNLMAVIRDRKDVYSEQLAALERRRASLCSASTDREQMDMDKGAQQNELEAVEHEIVRVQEQLQQEEAKFRRWHDENVRRKTNYVPFIFNFLTLLAERGQLQGLINRTKKLAAEKKQ